MPKAKFQATFNNSAIDSDKGIISGVKIMELGVMAYFANADGEAKRVMIEQEHIDKLLAHAGNRAIPSHYTHEWYDAVGKENADSVEMASRVGVFKQFRKDDIGSLIADYYLSPTEKRETILWGAANNPEDNMISVVFDYNKDDSRCIPTSFDAADLVPRGAATKALFSNQTQNNIMPPIDIPALIQALKDSPELIAAIKAIVGHVEDAADSQSETAAAEMEASAGVTDADKKPEDEQKPAAMRAVLRCNRAFSRQLAAIPAAVDKKAILEEAKVASEASVTALLGKGRILELGADSKTADEFETAITAQMAAGAKTRGKAILRIHSDKPELWERAKKAGKC